jgi:hypothetical protein
MSDRKKWYYASGGQQYGPLDDAVMQQLIQSQSVNASTLVWQEGMSGWTPLQDSSLRAIVPVGSAPLAVPAPQAPRAVVGNAAETFNQLFMWFWILLAASIPLSFLLIGIFTAIASVVIFYILLYRYWELIQDGNPQTTPAQAVGFSFIPFFNFYWNFIAIRGLAQDMNRYCRERNIPAPIVDEQLALWYCILTIFNAIPYLNFLTGIAALAIQIILLNSFNKTAVAIVNARGMH